MDKDMNFWQDLDNELIYRICVFDILPTHMYFECRT